MEWTRGRTIGRGSTAAVSLSTAASGELFAVKSTDISSSAILQKEQFLISQLCSPYIVKCFGSETTYEQNSGVYNLFLEYVPGGTLSDLIRNQGGSLTETAIQFYAHQMLQGLSYIHLNGLVHCDVKGQNMLICKDGLKIADFGCAKRIKCGTEPGYAGTPAYMAPEVARGEEQSFSADIWALGCTVIEMATGSNPWPEMKDPASALYRIGYGDEVPKIPSWFSGNGKDFVAKCLMRDPKVRCTAAELLQHPFMKSVGENCGEITEFTRKSPTSVMDQDFWDAMEVSNSSRNPTGVDSTSDSPASRIRNLIGSDISPNLIFSDWTGEEEEEDWVTVRGDEFENISEIVEQHSEMNEEYADSVNISSGGEEIQTSNTTEGSLLDCYSDEIDIVDEQSSKFLSGSVEDVSVLKFKYFIKVLMELFLHPIQLCLLLFSFILVFMTLFFRASLIIIITTSSFSFLQRLDYSVFVRDFERWINCIAPLEFI